MAVLVRGVISLVNSADEVLQSCGVKVSKVTYDSFLDGLPEDAQEQAEDELISKPLQLLAEGLEKDKRLQLVHRIVMIELQKRMLKSRAQIARTIKEKPEILMTPIRRPIFIIGLPRTGTTLLHQLLVEDEQFRAPMYWELMYPCPPGRPNNWKSCDRYKKAKKACGQLEYFLPRKLVDKVHKTRAHFPEECYHILGRVLFQYHNFLRIESLTEFSDWFYNLSHDQLKEIYEYYKKELKVIGYGGMDNQTYVLKSHMHLMCLDVIKEVFPDACFVFTYRKLSDMVGSFCSLSETVTKPWGRRDKEYGSRCVRLLSEFSNRAVNVMKQYDGKTDNPFHVVDYKTLTSDPISAVKGIYDHFGFQMTPETEVTMKRHLEDNPKNKHGRHQYNMADYGITEQDLIESFGPFIDYFKHKTPEFMPEGLYETTKL
jgi:hypothetical protein